MTQQFPTSKWSDYALCYDALTALLPYQELVRDVADELSPQNGDKILDACCGTGNLLVELVRRAPNASYTGVDFSNVMLNRARTKCDARFLEADLTQGIPFGSETFTKLACVNGLYTMPDSAHFLAECFRVLTRGGAAVIVTPKRGFENGLVLKAHCKSELPDEHWQNAHSSPERERALVTEALTDPVIISQMLEVARHNRAIAGTLTFTFFEPNELRDVAEGAGFRIDSCRPAYADQGILIVLKKE